MVRNEAKFQQAVQFRARGFTLEEIAKICDVSKSTVSKWLKNNATSASVTTQNKRRAGRENAKRLQLVNKARTGERANRYREAVRAAETEFKHYRSHPLFVAGVSVYAAAGDRFTPGVIRLSSARPALHRTFIRFSLEFLGVDKTQIRFWVLLYRGQSEEVCFKKWKATTSLPYAQFHKSQRATSKVAKGKTLHYGVGNTIIGNTVLKHKLNRWIELMEKELTK